MKSSFRDCFKKVLTNQSYQFQLPCRKPIAYSECVEYCEWHENYVQSTNLEELLMLMKFGMPQRAWITNSVSGTEEKMAAKVFNDSKTVKTLKSTRSPVPFAILCHKKDKGFIGQDVGFTTPVCNNFFPSPTDQGICMTENINIKEIIHDYEKYDVLMESSLQGSSDKIQGNAYWNEKTFVISLHNKPWRLDHHRRGEISDLDFIQMQLHQSGDFGQFLAETYFTEETETITLEVGHEYFIDVTPVGMRSSDDLKSLPPEARGCFIEDDIPKDSIFKKYSQSNCKYRVFRLKFCYFK